MLNIKSFFCFCFEMCLMSLILEITLQKGTDCLEKMVLNFQTSQIMVSKFSNVSINSNLLGFAVKSCQNFQNTIVFIFYKKFQSTKHKYFCKFR
jgi:hypothetical protein